MGLQTAKFMAVNDFGLLRPKRTFTKMVRHREGRFAIALRRNLRGMG